MRQKQKGRSIKMKLGEGRNRQSRKMSAYSQTTGRVGTATSSQRGQSISGFRRKTMLKEQREMMRVPIDDHQVNHMIESIGRFLDFEFWVGGCTIWVVFV